MFNALIHVRRFASLSAALALGLVIFALSLIGGGSLVPPAEAQRAVGEKFDPADNFDLKVPFEPHHDDNKLGPDGVSANHLNDAPENQDGKGAIITVTYTAAASQHSGCTSGPVTQRYRIKISGSVLGGETSLVDDRAALVDVPAAGEKCNYVANWVGSFSYVWRLRALNNQGQPWREELGPYSVSGNGFEFNADTEPIRVQYSLVSEFEPVIPISVPGDMSSPGVSLYTDLQFAVRLRPTASSPDGCTEERARPTDHGVEPGPTAQNVGFIVLSSGVVTWRKGAPSLVNVPQGAAPGERCEYQLWYRPSLTSADGGSGDWTLTLQGSRTETLHADLAAAEKVYLREPADPSFIPNVSISVPYIEPPGGNRNVLGNATVFAEYAPTATSPAGCTDADFDYFFANNQGSGSTTNAWPLDNAQSRASLVSMPLDATVPCRYVATFQTHLTAGTYSFPLVSGQSFEFGEGERVSAVYADAMTFEPMLSFTVAPAPTGGAMSEFAGVPITVTYTKMAGPSGCSPNGTLRYVVGNDGTAVPASGAPSLIDTVGGQTGSCEYEVRFPDTVSSMPGATSPWVLKLGGGSPTETLSESAASYSRSYAAVDAFAPDVSISVPQIDVTIDGTDKNMFSDVLTSAPGASAQYGPVTFWADFAPTGGSPAGCNEARAMYAVGADGSVTGDAPALIDRLTSGGAQCVYGVTFQTTGLRGGVEKLNDPSDDNEVMGGAATASATYQNAVLDSGVLDVVITTPLHGTGEGRTADVTVTASSGATACLVKARGSNSFSTSATRSVPLRASGTSADRMAFNYVDFPAGATSASERCTYDVTWSSTEMVSQGDSLWQLRSGSTMFVGAGRAEPTGELTAEYGVGPAQTQFFDATLELTLSARVAQGTMFTVSVRQAANQSPGCSDAPSDVLLTAPAPNSDGTDQIVTHSLNGLVDRPSDVGQRCRYEVAWPQNENSGMAYIEDPDFTAGTVLNGGTRTASHRYIADETTFAVTFEVLSGGTDGPPDTTPFTATVAPTTGSPADCTAETFDVLVGNPTQTTLIDSPLDDAGRCTYTVTWSTSEKNGAVFVEDASYASQKTTTLNASSTRASNQYIRRSTPAVNPGSTNPPVNPGSTNPAVNPGGNTGTGGTTRRTATGGGGGSRSGGSSGGGGSRGGSSGGGSSGGGAAATGPWVVPTTGRVPVAVSLAMPERDFPVGTAIEVMLNVPGTCGDDTTAFAGLPANIGLVYALTARSGTTAQVLAANALQLAGFAQRGDDISDCEVRITLITAPDGCRLDSTGTNNGGTDDAGRSYVQLTGGADLPAYSATPSLICA